MELFIAMVLGHFVADYLLQNKQMALVKSEASWRGWIWCTAHCLIYTCVVATIAGHFSPVFLALVYLSHFPIDRWSLASKWLSLIGGRTFEQAYTSTDKFREFDIAFTAIVYTVCDNTTHIILLYLIARFFAG